MDGEPRSAAAVIPRCAVYRDFCLHAPPQDQCPATAAKEAWLCFQQPGHRKPSCSLACQWLAATTILSARRRGNRDDIGETSSLQSFALLYTRSTVVHFNPTTMRRHDAGP
ncbi:unnamed protein product [Cercospora beticola]|nr:unnamed protein product [Cercospora beticola]